MPKELEKKLKAKARKMGLSKNRAGAYIYGTLRKTGWKPSKSGGILKRGLKRFKKGRKKNKIEAHLKWKRKLTKEKIPLF